MILLHYTGMQDAVAALQRLCSPESKVSAHYVVFEDGRIVQCVPESERAWHAGVSFWAGETDINSCSIGIEIANPGHDFGYPDFPSRQIAAVIALCRGIIARRGNSRGSRTGAFRCGAVAQAGSGREISLAPAEQFRRRTVGEACAHQRGAAVVSRCDRRSRDERCNTIWQLTATASESAPNMTRRPRMWSRRSSAISGRSKSTASPTARPWRRWLPCLSGAACAGRERQRGPGCCRGQLRPNCA